MTPWSLRSLASSVALMLRILERTGEQERFVKDGCFDIGSLPIPASALKASKNSREIRDVTYVVCHITAVTGGFGLAKSVLVRWRRLVADPTLGGIPQPIIDQLLDVGDVIRADGGYSVVDPERLARRLGIWERYRSVPYHQIASQAGDVVANRDLTQRSHHAGPGNDGAGFAVDCGPGEEPDDDLVATGRHGLLMLGRRMAEGGSPTPIGVVPHRVFTSSRRRDTDRAVWAHIVKPVLVAHPDLFRADYERRVDSGRPIPRSWDEDALFDEAGRRV